jgi:hypothetical protein
MDRLLIFAISSDRPAFHKFRVGRDPGTIRKELSGDSRIRNDPAKPKLMSAVEYADAPTTC